MAYDSGTSFDDTAPLPDASPAAPPGPSEAATLLTMEATAAAGALAAPGAATAGGGWDDGDGSDGGAGGGPLGFLPTTPSLDGDDDGGTGRRRPARERVRRKGWFGWLLGLFGMGADDRHDVHDLLAAVQRARQLHPGVGHQFTAEVATPLGHGELDGRSADEQVATMRARWREVRGHEATALASAGVLVVAALEGRGGERGHTAVVVPGPGARVRGRYYPNVACGGPPARYSSGDRSAAEVWTADERERVRYHTPR